MQGFFNFLVSGFSTPLYIKDTRGTHMLKNRYFIIGLILLVVGSGPLITTLLLAKLGLTADPNPNPVIFGMMAGFTFWPGILLVVLGGYTHYKESKKGN